MPFLHLQVGAAPSPALTAQLISALTELTGRVLRKEPAHVALAIEYVDPTHWSVGGNTLAALGRTSFFLVVRLTAGTNTKDEKAAYQQQAFTRLGELLGALHPVSYVCVQEVGADAYGYGGLTQEYRYVAGQLAAATAH